MADRPAFAVISVMGKRAVRLEYYEGHDALSLRYDVRSPELAGKDLPAFMGGDTDAYDPVAFLQKHFGLYPEITKPLLDELHRGGDESTQ